MPNMQPTKTPMKTVGAEIRKKNFDPFLLGYTEEEAVNEASRCLHCPNPKCKEGCPIHNNIPEFLAATANREFDKAYEILLENTVMPDICGTVCPHEDQCQGHCIRGIRQECVNIGAVERFIAERAHEKGLDKILAKPNGKRVACIGSGPASMAFALTLINKGYAVDIYEKENYLGGVLTWGIPSYRLDTKVTQRYFDKLKAAGANFYLNYKVGPEHPLNELKDKYDALFIGIGAPTSNKMRIPGEDLDGVYASDDYLSDINLKEKDEEHRKHFSKPAKKVLVVGGGNVAMDAARDSIRLKDNESVTIVYRRSEEEMPACKAELDDAKEEGIVFQTLTNPVAFIGDENGKLIKAECAIMELGEPDSSGRRRPIESSKPHIFIDCDVAVLALGFSNDGEIATSIEGLNTDKWGCILVDENNQSSIENVYAGGDGVTGASTVVKAMKAGINAARHFANK